MNNDSKKVPFQLFLNLKLVHKLLISYIALIIIPLVLLSLIFYKNFSNFATKYVTYSTKQSFDQAYSFLSYKLNNVKDASNILLNNNNIINTIESDITAKDDVHQMESRNVLLTFLTSLQNKTDISSIRLYVPDELLYSNDNRNIFKISSVVNTKWYKMLRQNKTYLWTPSSYLGPGDTNSDTLSLTELLLSPENYKNSIAAVRVDFNKDDVIQILKKASTFTNSLSYIQNSQGEIVATSSNDFLKKYDVNKISFSNSSNDITHWITYHYLNSYALVGYHLFKNTDWNMVTIIPLGNILIVSNPIRNLIIIFLLLTLSISCVIAYIISHSITNGISELCNNMHNLHNEKLEPITISHRKDEIGMLIDDYNYMTERMAELIKEQYKSGQMLKTSELKALQSQINPHFLYNTLDMINWFARNQKGEEITVVVDALSQFYRISLSSGRDIISIRDELAHVSSYFKIQNMRFKNNLKLNITIPEEILDYGILKITLQPIVENAILHGILFKESKAGTIQISGNRNQQDIILTIHDDGIGITSDNLDKIMRGEKSSQGGSSFGLKNIQNRIKLYYGNKYGLCFSSELGRGTTIQIRIAVEKL